MDSSQLFGIAMIAYLLAAAFYLGLFLFKTERIGLIGTLLTLAGICAQTAAIGLRWHESYQMGIGHVPLTNMYESLVFFSWCTACFYLALEYRFKTRVMGVFVMACVTAAMAYASFSDRIDSKISPLIPALQSDWLIAHVVTCFIGYAAFAVAGALGLLYLIRQAAGNRPERSGPSLADTLPSLRVIDDLTHKTIVFGFIWLSAGIVTGAVWANEAWGTYWSWDPKETWSIITWFLYAMTLHARFTRGWQGQRIAWLAMLGFVAVFFTYFGVNFLLSGLHSYGSV
ncbi:MAG: c-type cytochrome biogenesis protein CcsB [Desulfobulbus sp.]|nr:c-type cytochrome biogenesis protein CcsB [Desulfobulbus sp.]